MARHGGIGGDTGDVTGRRVHGIDGTVEAPVEQVPEDLVPDRPPPLTGAHYRDRLRSKQALDGTYRGLIPPLVDDFDGGLGRVDVHGDPNHARFVVAALDEAGVAEHVAHPLVAGQGLGHEAVDAPGAGEGRQVLEQQRAQSSPLMGVLDHKCHLRSIGLNMVVAGHGDDLLVEDGYQGHAPVMVHVGEPFHLLRPEVAVVREETQANCLVGQSGVKGQQRRPVLGRDRTDMHGAAIGQHGVGRAPSRVAPTGHPQKYGSLGRRGPRAVRL